MGNSQCGLVEVRFVGKRISVEGFHVLETFIISGACRLWSLVSYYCRHCNIYRIIQFQPDKVNIKALFRYFKSYKKRTEYDQKKKKTSQCDFMSKTFVSYVKEMSAEAELKLGCTLV